MSINEAATIQTTSINAITPTTGTLSVGNTQTTGVMNLGTGVRTAAGVMNIATGVSNACAINIMNGGGATTGGSVNIANGALQTTTVNIASGTSTGAITIGNTGNTTTLGSGITNIRGTLGVTGGISANGGLTMGGSNNITLGNGSVAPTSTQLGYTLSSTSLNTFSSSGFNRVIGNATFNMFSAGLTLTPGSWLITYTVQFTSDNATTNWCNVLNTYLVRGASSTNYGTFVGAQVFLTSQKTTGFGTPISNNGDFRPSASGVITVAITASTTYNVQGFLSLVSAQVGNFVLVPGYCNIVGTRIA
jgi:hypothetical protein